MASFGAEMSDFVNALGVGTKIQDQFSQMRYRRQQGGYYDTLADQQAAETAEYTDPEVQRTRRETARAAADTALAQARQQRLLAEQSEYEFGEYSSPEYAGMRRENTQAVLDQNRAAADQARLAANRAELEWLEYASPQAAANRRQAEALAAAGNYAGAVQTAIATQTQLNGLSALQQEAAARKLEIWQARHPGEDPPAELLARAEAEPIGDQFLTDFFARHGIDQTAVASGGVPAQGALPVAPRGAQGLVPTNGAAPAAPATTGALGPNGLPAVADMEAYIREAAAARGVDPDIAVRVARSEGLAEGVWQSTLPAPGGGAGREASYGPFQLYTGGGLGNQFIQQTGLDPRDPSTWRQQVDFALDAAKQGGWTPWYGAAKAGVSRWTGINPNAPGVSPNAPPLATSSVSTSPPVMNLPVNLRPAGTPAVPATGTTPPPPAPAGASAPAPAAGRPSFHDSASEMAREGNRQRYAGLTQPTGVPTPEQTEAARALYRGDGGADPAALQAVDEFLSTPWDYENLPPTQRKLVNAVAAYNHAKNIDPEKAKGLAGELIRTRMAEAMKFHAFARAAAEQGDEEGAVTAEMRALASIPNNVDASFEKQEDGDYLVSFVRGSDGKEVHREIVNPDRLLGTIWNAGPRDIDKMLYLFAGETKPGPSEGMAAQLSELQRNPWMTPDFSVLTGEGELNQFLQAQKAAQEAGGVSVEDRGAIATGIADIEDEIIGPAVSAYAPEAQAIIGQHQAPLKGIAERLVQTNQDLGAGPAVMSLFGDMLRIPDPARPYADPTFAVTQDESGNPVMDAQGNYTVNTRSGPNMRMSPDDYAYVTGLREEIQNQLAAANQLAQQGERRGAAEAEESDRLAAAGLPVARPGGRGVEGPQRPLDYATFEEQWLAMNAPQPGMTTMEGVEPPDYSEIIREEYQRYLQNFPLGGRGGGGAAGR